MATKKTPAKPVRKTNVDKASNKTVTTKQLEEALRKQRELAERLKVVNGGAVGKQVSGFVTFLREQSVVGLAIGLVLGTQAKQLVDQLIASFINPLVGLLLPGQGTLKDKIFIVHWGGKEAAFGWGAFVISLLTFVVVAAVVYYVFKGLKLDRLDKKKEG